LDNDLSRFDSFLKNAKARKEPRRDAREFFAQYTAQRSQRSAAVDVVKADEAQQSKQPLKEKEDFLK